MDCFGLSNQFPVEPGQPDEVLLLRQHLRLEGLQTGGQSRIDEMLGALQPGDRLLVSELSRLGRSDCSERWC